MADINGLRLYPEEDVKAIADAIRLANSGTSSYTLSQIPSAISQLPTPGTGEKSMFLSCFNNNYQTLLISYCINNVQLTKVKPYAFYYYSGNSPALSTANFTKVSYIGSSAFYTTSYWGSIISFPNCITVDRYAFASVKDNITTLSFPNCTYVGQAAFASFNSLTSIYFPKCKFIGGGAFYASTTNNVTVTSLDFPECTIIKNIPEKTFNTIRNDGATFANFSYVSNISFPKLEILDGSAFYKVGTNATGYVSCYFPVLSLIGSGAFSYAKVSTLSFPMASEINYYAFASCYNLLSLYLPGSFVCSLRTSNAFASTPISNYTTSTGGVYGSIYVPSNLLATYKSATNWVTYSARMVAIT